MSRGSLCGSATLHPCSHILAASLWLPPACGAERLSEELLICGEIAAKIDSIPHLNNSTPLVDPSVYGYGVQKRPLDDGVGNQLGALVHQRAVITEEFKVPDKMVGFIIGRGGEQISRIQAESGCKIQIASESSGIPERPCVLTGTPESIEQAKRLLGQIVDRCRNGPGFHNDVDGNSTIQEILIPASKVGLVIGKGGETIKQLQERTGVKMVMIQDGPLPTGADKPLRITGDPFKVQQAREMVLEIIREKDQADFRGVRGDFSSRLGGGSIEVSVPRFAVGIVIGRNGEMIKKIQNDAGVRVQFKPDDGISPERAAQVMGPPDRCQHAAHIINELILTAQERDGFGGLAVARGRGRGRGDWNVGAPGGIQEITYTVPADKCGLVIGKGGENIKSINQQSGAHVELQRNPPPNTDPGLRIFTIRGVPQQIEVARHLIDEKVGVNGNPHSTPVSGPPAFLTQGWGSTYQAWQQPTQQVPSQQSQPQSSQPDYSKAWEDYYKKQSHAGHAASAAPQASSPPDYTMAWAEYYRQQVAFYGQTLGQAQAHSQNALGTTHTQLAQATSAPHGAASQGFCGLSSSAWGEDPETLAELVHLLQHRKPPRPGRLPTQRSIRAPEKPTEPTVQCGPNCEPGPPRGRRAPSTVAGRVPVGLPLGQKPRAGERSGDSAGLFSLQLAQGDASAAPAALLLQVCGLRGNEYSSPSPQSRQPFDPELGFGT
ncbi:Far upstream element-binding protein 3 [Fukomys damarensis]|uniref:Far upstream element-binding protein 3 n=1 Tax=Fukomys damarensis TaxID=885580 RepID=A0A091DLF8_FUKDA|nr:Far upstream element-binding protein 3 [Fukomys damarensis]